MDQESLFGLNGSGGKGLEGMDHEREKCKEGIASMVEV